MNTATTRTRAVEDPRPATADVLVDTPWLADHLDDPRVRVVEVDVSPKAFAEGHIDGAMLWNIYTDLKDQHYQPVEKPAVEQLLSSSGIAADSIVVFYGYGPALGFWLMKLYGHRDVRILNASRDQWLAEGRPWSTVEPTPERCTYRLGEEDLRLRATQTMVKQEIDHPGTVTLDVRTRAEFLGERFWPSGGMEEGGRAGHVPGATHLPADELYDARGAFLDRDELAKLYEPVHPTQAETIISYCTIGGRASTTWFVLTYLLGHDNVRVYDGSWAEWGRQRDTPVAQ